MTQRTRVLVVEDEVLIAWDLQAELESRGYDVAGPAGTLVEAMEVLGGGRVSIAVLDINLGKDTSYDIARRCLDNGVGVVFLSGDGGDMRPDELRKIELVTKPVDYNALDLALSRVMAQ
jgi:DNA-binding response OmpR family regulator